MQNLNNLEIAIIGGTISAVIGGLLLKAIGNIKIPKIDLVAIVKIVFVGLLGFVFWFVGSIISYMVYTACASYVGCVLQNMDSLVLMAQATTIIGTIALLGITSRLFRAPNK